MEWAYWEIGRRGDAEWASARAYELNSSSINTTGIRAVELAEFGHYEESRALLESIMPEIQRVQRGFDVAAVVYGHLGDIDEAVKWMELAIEHKNTFVVTAKIPGHQTWRHLQDEPRFQALVDEIDVPESWGRLGGSGAN